MRCSARERERQLGTGFGFNRARRRLVAAVTDGEGTDLCGAGW